MARECNCDQVRELQAELAVVRAERDYLAAFADPKELVTMRRELADGWSESHALQCDCDACLNGARETA